MFREKEPFAFFRSPGSFCLFPRCHLTTPQSPFLSGLGYGLELAPEFQLLPEVAEKWQFFLLSRVGSDVSLACMDENLGITTC